MKILAIETSCDETAVAALDIQGNKEMPEIKVLANELFSQAHLHKEYGGVYPNLAKREHLKNLPSLLSKCLKDANLSAEKPDIDYIAVTQGPGLEPALWTGINFAEDLSEKWDKPLIPVNHMEGHIFSVLYEAESPLEFPALALLVSGGHTELVRVDGFGDYKIIGKTRDDAAGEAFDKVARMLELPYPGGPQISTLAQTDRNENEESEITFPRPMLHSGDLDFSFSGLKTAVLYKVKNLNIKNQDTKAKIARAFEDAVVDILTAKTDKALEEAGDIRSLIMAGGVSANTRLREKMKSLSEKFEIPLKMPEKELATDNAIMIGIAGFIRAEKTEGEPSSSPSVPISAQGNLSL